jgi:TonB family protein
MRPVRTTLSACLFASLVAGAPVSAQPGPTPPAIATFVHADYPDAARASGQEAAVELEITIGADGLVRDARVLAPVGDGFDEAALAAVRQFVFEPATKHGHPIAARIHYRYVFTLPPSADAAAAIAVPVAGRIEGRILSRAGGEPLTGVQVTVTTATGVAHRAVTDEAGGFAIGELATGHYHVEVAALDHAAFTQDEDVVAGEVATVTYRLDPVTAHDAVGSYAAVATIVAPAREITRRSIEAEEMTKIPGTRGDALRAVELLPGIARPPGGAGVIIVRGSAPADSQVFLDGAPVDHLYHFGGLTSFVNGSLLARVDLYPGNFSTHYGRKIGGVVEAELRDPRTDRHHADLDINMIDASVLVEGPIGSKASFAVAGRRSYIDAWIGPVLAKAGVHVAAAPVYTDWQAIATYKPNPHDKLRLIGYGSGDELSLVLADPSREPTNHDRFGEATAMSRVRADWTHSWPGVEQVISLTTGTHVYDVQLGGELTEDVDGLEVFGRADWRATLSRLLCLSWGLDIQHTVADIHYHGPRVQQDEGNPDQRSRPDPMNDAHLDTTGTWFRPAAYVEATVTPTAPFAVTAGLRVDRFGEIGEWAVDPRLTARYSLGATTLKGGVGRFSQPPEQGAALPEVGNPELRAEHALHCGLGVDHQLSRRVSVGVEGYYKRLDHMIVEAPSGMLENTGTGRIYGVEVAGRWQPGGRFSGFLSYSLSRSERNDGGAWRLFDNDQTHILTVSGSTKLGHGWELGGTFRLTSGNPETPVVGSIFDADIDTYRPVYGATNSARNPTFHRLDVRVEKQFQLAGRRCAGYLDLQNAYNQRNLEGTSYSFDYSQRQAIPGLPIIPSLGIKGEL